MKQIRPSAFETNSSSSHSITIDQGMFVPAKLHVGSNGVLEIFPGEFGWGVDHFTDAPTKASYCLTWLKVMEHVDDVELETEMLIGVLKRVTGAETVEFVPAYTEETKSQYDCYPWGYIDHQSIENGGGVGREAFLDKDMLERFIFNTRSVLTIDNDNH